MLLQMVNEHAHFITLLTVLVSLYTFFFFVKMVKIAVYGSVLFNYWQGVTFSYYQHFYFLLSKKPPHVFLFSY